MVLPQPSAPRRRGRRGLWILAVVGLVVLLCVGVGVVRFALPRLFVQHEGELPASTFGLTAACEKAGTAFTSAPAFDGPAPHPMEVVTAAEGQSVGLTDTGGVAGATGGSAWDALMPAQVQLVACAKRTATGAVVGRCKYTLPGLPAGSSGSDVPLRSATFEITVYEARTHHEVTRVSNVVAADTTCPPTLVRSSDDKGDVYAQLSAAQIRQLFGRWLG